MMQAFKEISLALLFIDEEQASSLVRTLFHNEIEILSAKELTLEKLDSHTHSLFAETQRALVIVHANLLKEREQNALFSAIEKRALRPPTLFLIEKPAASALRRRIESNGGRTIDCVSSGALVALLIEIARGEGLMIGATEARHLVELFDKRAALLFSELEKLIAYGREKKGLSIEEIDEIVGIEKRPQSLFQIGDAIYQRDFAYAYTLARRLLEEGESIFVIIAHLKTQVRQGLAQLTLFQREGKEALLARFPYLSSGLLEKKLSQLKNYGERGLREALLSLNHAELKLKSSDIAPLLSLELLLIHLTTPSHGALASSKPPR